jgi:hypothetical protein
LNKHDRLIYEFLFPYTKNTKEAYGYDIKLFKEYCYSIGASGPNPPDVLDDYEINYAETY